MGQKLLTKAGIIMTVFMLVFIAGCSKTDNAQNVNTENSTKAEEPTAKPEEQAVQTDTDKAEEQDTTTSGSDSESNTSEATAEVPVVIQNGIKDIYAEYDMMAGTCLSDAMIAISKNQDIIKREFNQVTLENYTKPDYILSLEKSVKTGELSVEFTQKTTKLLDWAKENGMKVRGHVLVWYSQTPDWIFYKDFDKSKELVDRDTMLARMESYIKQTFEQLKELGYLENFYAYDIVNEAIMEDGSLRDCLWKQIIGEDYIWYAFKYADQYAPESVKLYYNDYNEQFKTSHVVALAKSLVDETGRSLIDGIGCQGHLYTKDPINQYINTLKAFSKLGLDVQITELDVSLGTWQNIEEPTEENLKAQGQYYYELVNRIIEENKAGTTKVSGITYWGFADQMSWRKERSPLLFDGKMNPKYSYYGAKQEKANAGY